MPIALFFPPLFRKFSFQVAAPPPPPAPITQTILSLMHHSWFCSLMHSLSLSQPHYQIFIIGFYPAFWRPPFTTCNVLVLVCLAAASWLFLFYVCSKALSLTSSLLFQPFIWCYFSPISHSSPFPSLSLFSFISSAFSHPSSSLSSSRTPSLVLFHMSLHFLSLSSFQSVFHSLAWVTECYCPGLSNGIILNIRAASMSLHIIL